MKLNDYIKDLEKHPIDLALKVEAAWYDKETKRIETAEHFEKTLQPIQLPMFRRGVSFRNSYTGEVFGKRKIGFFITTTSPLAHTNVLATYTKRAKDYTPIVYIIDDKPGKDLEGRYGCAVRYIEYGDSWHERLQDLCREDEIDALFVVSCPVWASFLSGMRPAAKIGWWSYKYHNLRIPGLDAYVSTHLASECTWKHANGNTWHNTPGAYDYLYDPEAEKQAAEIRKDPFFTDKVILGVMGRNEKLNNPEYAAVISDILRDNPRAYFLFTAKGGVMPEALRGLPGTQAACIGWVDTKVWAHLFDIYCDSFPFPSGQTFCEVAMAGKPIVSLLGSPESKQASILADTDEKDHHELGVRRTTQTYYELIDYLIDDPEGRVRYGHKIREWVLTNKMNTDIFRDSFERVVGKVLK
jgi:hypothetical protein